MYIPLQTFPPEKPTPSVFNILSLPDLSYHARGVIERAGKGVIFDRASDLKMRVKNWHNMPPLYQLSLLIVLGLSMTAAGIFAFYYAIAKMNWGNRSYNGWAALGLSQVGIFSALIGLTFASLGVIFLVETINREKTVQRIESDYIDLRDLFYQKRKEIEAFLKQQDDAIKTLDTRLSSQNRFSPNYSSQNYLRDVKAEIETTCNFFLQE